MGRTVIVFVLVFLYLTLQAFSVPNINCTTGTENRTLILGLQALQQLLVNRQTAYIPFFCIPSLTHILLLRHPLPLFRPITQPSFYNATVKNLTVISTMQYYAYMMNLAHANDEALSNDAVYSEMYNLVVSDACRYVSPSLISFPNLYGSVYTCILHDVSAGDTAVHAYMSDYNGYLDKCRLFYCMEKDLYGIVFYLLIIIIVK